MQIQFLASCISHCTIRACSFVSAKLMVNGLWLPRVTQPSSHLAQPASKPTLLGLYFICFPLVMVSLEYIQRKFDYNNSSCFVVASLKKNKNNVHQLGFFVVSQIFLLVILRVNPVVPVLSHLHLHPHHLIFTFHLSTFLTPLLPHCICTAQARDASSSTWLVLCWDAVDLFLLLMLMISYFYEKILHNKMP